MISAHLPALQVVVPMLAAPLALLFRHPKVSWAIAAVASTLSSVIAWVLLSTVLRAGTWTYDMGGWEAPVGIVYVVDLPAAWMLVLVSTLAAVVAWWAPVSVAQQLEPERHAYLWSAWLLATTGLLGIVITGDAFNVFVFLEISSLASYTLVALGPDRRALTAAYRYLIMGSLGGTFLLIGIGLMYQMTGTLNLADLAARLPEVAHTRAVLVSFAFVTVGASLKLALWPLHAWLPNAYAYAPHAVSAFISATGTKVMVFVLLRFAYGVYGRAFAFDELGLGLPLMALALGGIYVASAVAIGQVDVKRLLAFSSVAQIGYMILGLAVASVAGVTASILHLAHHALIKGGMFLALGQIATRTGSTRLGDLHGAVRVMPWSVAALLIGGAGLIGVPGTAGFITKVVLVKALWAEGLWPVAMLAIFSSLLAVAYVWRIVEAVWFHPPSEALEGAEEVGVAMSVWTWVLIGGSVVLGLWAEQTVTVATWAAEILLGGHR